MVGGDRQTFRTPQRVHFFDGQLLTAGDFRDEQAYHLEKSRLHNRLFHGSGVVSGLKVGEAGGTTVLVQSGVALDGLGREIMVSEARQIDAAQPSLTTRENRQVHVSPKAPSASSFDTERSARNPAPSLCFDGVGSVDTADEI